MPVELTDGSIAPNEVFEKIVALIYGLSGVGKSALGLSFPGPHWLCNFDRPISGLREAWATRKLTLESFPMDVDSTTKSGAVQYLAKFDAMVRAALASPIGGTFMVDGWDIFWDIVKIAKLPGSQEETAPKEWADANEYMNNHIRRLGMSKLNVVFTSIASPIWTGMKSETQRMKADGYKHKDRWLTHEIYVFSPDDMEKPNILPMVGPTSPTGQKHSAYIGRSKLNEKLIGRVVPNLTYATLFALTFGHAYPEPERLWSPAKAAVAAPAVAGG